MCYFLLQVKYTFETWSIPESRSENMLLLHILKDNILHWAINFIELTVHYFYWIKKSVSNENPIKLYDFVAETDKYTETWISIIS